MTRSKCNLPFHATTKSLKTKHFWTIAQRIRVIDWMKKTVEEEGEDKSASNTVRQFRFSSVHLPMLIYVWLFDCGTIVASTRTTMHRYGSLSLTRVYGDILLLVWSRYASKLTLALVEIVRSGSRSSMPKFETNSIYYGVSESNFIWTHFVSLIFLSLKTAPIDYKGNVKLTHVVENPNAI